MRKFKQEVLESIKSDADLFAKVAKAMDILPGSLPQTLERNSKSLNQYEVYTVVATHLKKDIEDLLEKRKASKAKAA